MQIITIIVMWLCLNQEERVTGGFLIRHLPNLLLAFSAPPDTTIVLMNVLFPILIALSYMSLTSSDILKNNQKLTFNSYYFLERQ